MHPDKNNKKVREHAHAQGHGRVHRPDLPSTPTVQLAPGGAEAPGSRARLHPRRHPVQLWLAALCWNSIAFPIAALCIRSPGPFWAPVLGLIFVGIGLTLGWEACQQSWLAWRYRGSCLQIRPARPRGGDVLEVSLHGPRSAHGTWPAGEPLHWCLTQHRIDDTSSGSPEREVERIDAPARLHDLGALGLRLSARLDIPRDAPPDGCQRGGDRVAWRLSLRTARDRILQDYEVPVRDAPPPSLGHPGSAPLPAASADLPDRFSRLPAPPANVDIPPAPPGARPPPLPAGVQWRELPHAGVLSFSQRGWHLAGLLSLLLGVGWLLARRDTGVHGLGGLGPAACLAFALHATTRRWQLHVLDDGLRIERQSWLWVRRDVLPASALARLCRREAYRRHHDGALRDFHALHTPEPLQAGGTRLSPALAGARSAEDLASFLRWAWAQRQGRFSPGAERDARRASLSQPGWALALLVAGIVWLLLRH